MSLVATIPGLFTLAAAVLVCACQQPSSSVSGETSAYQQKMDGDMAGNRERRCCHRASRTGNK